MALVDTASKQEQISFTLTDLFPHIISPVSTKNNLDEGPIDINTTPQHLRYFKTDSQGQLTAFTESHFCMCWAPESWFKTLTRKLRWVDCDQVLILKCVILVKKKKKDKTQNPTFLLQSLHCCIVSSAGTLAGIVLHLEKKLFKKKHLHATLLNVSV